MTYKDCVTLRVAIARDLRFLMRCWLDAYQFPTLTNRPGALAFWAEQITENIDCHARIVALQETLKPAKG